MIRITLKDKDFKKIRFAISPAFELVMAFRSFLSNQKGAGLQKWLLNARAKRTPEDFIYLAALVRREGYIPDFLTPPPCQAQPDFANDLAAILKTKRRLVMKDIEKVRSVYGLKDEVYDMFRLRPKAALKHVAEEMSDFWNIALKRYWGKCRSFMESDILYRAHGSAFNGLESIFSHLGDDIGYKKGVLQISKKHHADVRLEGKELFLIPSVFSYPHAYVIFDKPWTPSLIYPVYDKDLFSMKNLRVSYNLQVLAGSTVTLLLQLLDHAHTTLELSDRMKLTPSAVSQHLGRLSQTDLVNRFREGRQVFYVLSEKGRAALLILKGD